MAVTLAWFFLEDVARMELAALSVGAAGCPPTFSPGQAAARAVWAGGVAERVWGHLTADDVEATPAK